ncbi:MAG: HD domain-containing phosphohydrolase [Thermoleophilia bacterium]
MRENVSVNLGNLLLSLSDALDLTDPSLAAHQQRTAFICWEICKVAGLSESDTQELFAASLLHDIGALTPEEKIMIHDNAVENLETHCIFGELIFEDVPAIEKSAQIVRHHHKKWEDWDEPIDAPLVLKSQILALSDLLERSLKRDQYILHQSDKLISGIDAISGTSLHPLVVDAFKEAARREEFWLDLTSPRLYSLLINYGPFEKVEIDFANIFSFADLFRVIIDFRSHFTATHSSGIAASAVALAGFFGFTEAELKLMELAGYLHDLGKLVVPNSILEKPGKLDPDEFAVMRQHTYFTYMILNAIDGLEQVAEWAAYHHEKLDGSGYPFHLSAKDIPLGSRILAVADIFTALAEDRPYRKGMEKPGIEDILYGMVNDGKLDKRVAKTLFDNYDEIIVPMREKQVAAMEFYEQRFSKRARQSFDKSF